MSDVKQTIQVTNTGLSPILSIAQGTGMVDFEFTISDFQIPAGSTAVAWNIQPTGNIVSQVCTLVENVITVTPPAYYFLRGKNYMQIQVTGADGVNLFTFLIEVWCSPNISAPVVSQNPDLITQLMAMIGNTQDLDTTAKNNLVAAINEIYARGVVDILDTEEEIEANTDAGKATGALVTKQLISDLGGCRFGYTEDGLPGYKKDGADTVYPFSSVRSISGVFSAYLPAGGIEAYTVINKPDNVSIKRITIQINRNINEATYVRVITRKDEVPTTVVQYTSVNQPPVLNEDISFGIADDPDSVEIQAQTVSGGSMPQTNITYTVDFSNHMTIQMA